MIEKVTKKEERIRIRHDVNSNRFRQIFATALLLLILQIFNGMDWNCALRSHFAEPDSDCRSEHRMETTPQPVSDFLTAQRSLLSAERTVPFFLRNADFKDQRPIFLTAGLPKRAFRLSEWNPGASPPGAGAFHLRC